MFIDTITYKGYTIKIHSDEDPESPREFDNLSIMVFFHNRYNLGDKDHGYDSPDFSGWDELKKQIIKDHNPVVISPVYLYDHGGITISTKDFSHIDNLGFDWGMIGYAFIPKKYALENWDKKRISKKIKEMCQEILMGEIEDYDKYIRGDIYGYEIRSRFNEHVESLFGIYGLEETEKEAKDLIDHILSEKEKEYQKS